MKGQGGGGTAKGGGKNKSAGQNVKMETSKPRQTAAINDNIVALRAALFDENGKDKDVTKEIARSFMKFDRNGLDISIEFATKLRKEDAKWAFELVKESMEEKYDTSGYGWDDEDKMRELTEKGARFLVVRKRPSEEGQTTGEPVGFVHFRFTVQGEVIDKMAGEASLHIYDIHIEDHYQRKGLGKHLLMLLELVARREKMKVLSVPVQLTDAETKEWLTHAGRGWAVDESLAEIGFDADLEGFTVYSKLLGTIKRTAVPPPVSVTEATTVFSSAVETAAAAVTATAPVTESTSPEEGGDKTATAVKVEEGDVIEEGGWLCI